MLAQLMFICLYLPLYLCTSRLVHRFVGFMEEEAVISYTKYLDQIDAGHIDNTPAPLIAINYWHLPPNARLRDVVIAIREDEKGHRDNNHYLANFQSQEKKSIEQIPVPKKHGFRQ